VLVSYYIHGKFVKKYSRFKGYTGFMVRGSFGRALRDISCISMSESCIECKFYRNCIYAKMFESTSRIRDDVKIAVKSGKSGITKPYTVSQILYSNMDGRLFFKINVFGREFIENELRIIAAIIRMGDEGVGYDLSLNERRRFMIKSIIANDVGFNIKRKVFDYIDGIYFIPPKYVYRNLLDMFSKRALGLIFQKPRKILIEWRSPFRIISNGEMVEQPTLDMIIANIARKYSVLAEYYDIGEPLTPEEVYRMKEALKKYSRLIRYRYRYISLKKFSIERNTEERLGKFIIGKYLYEVDKGFWRRAETDLILKLLILGEYLHVGRLATAGCGEYSIYWQM